jgi:hypothetical protein
VRRDRTPGGGGTEERGAWGSAGGATRQMDIPHQAAELFALSCGLEMFEVVLQVTTV